MHFVQIADIDGYKIVRNFEPPSIDPVATAKIIDPLMLETDEHKYLEKLRAEFGELERRRQALLISSRRARNHAELQATQRSYESVIDKQTAIQKKAVEHKPKYTAKRAELFKSHAVRFVVPGCKEIDEKTKIKLANAFNSLGQRQFLTIDGHVLTDRRGFEFWYKNEFDQWIDVAIKALDDEIPTGAKIVSELTDDEKKEILYQKNISRIAALSDAEKRTEREQKIKDALAIAAKYRSQYEIEGRADPLGDSKQWFCEEKSRIEKLYQ